MHTKTKTKTHTPTPTGSTKDWYCVIASYHVTSLLQPSYGQSDPHHRARGVPGPYGSRETVSIRRSFQFNRLHLQFLSEKTYLCFVTFVTESAGPRWILVNNTSWGSIHRGGISSPVQLLSAQKQVPCCTKVIWCWDSLCCTATC
jgi:hypothetical protein